jgi:hypothetical protein
MTNASNLPAWVSYFPALTVPIIAAIGLLIAARQMLIADDRMDFDIYQGQRERRFAIYEATRKFLASVYDDSISEDSIRAYGLHALDAQFLFDDGEELYKYLREVHSRVATWYAAEGKATKLPLGDDKNAQKQIATQNLDWINKQGDERTGFAVRFNPFLAYRPRRRAWLLRWP